jgi:hypothetical protein
MEEVVVVSYNMSFMSDKMKHLSFASEFAFLSINDKKKEENEGRIYDPRKYWKNAKDLLEQFITEQTKTCVIGLQEMNYTEKGTDTGSDAIDSMLKEVNEKKGTNYKQLCKFTTVIKKGVPEDLAASIIYDTDKFGDIKKSVIWDNYDTEKQKDNNEGKGRPTLLIVTDKNYVFITMHGAQEPKFGRNKTKFNQYMIKENKNKSEERITEHLNAFGFDETNSPTDIFLMADLNDRYDAITHFNILGKKLFYSGKSPKSCCYNYDSSCTDERYMKEYDPDSEYFTDTTYDDHRKGREIKLEGFIKELDYGTCLDDKSKNDFKKPMPNEEDGWTKNYRYKGDKVFGRNPISKINIYEGKTHEKTSVESDHQMVYATFEIKLEASQVTERQEAPLEALQEESTTEGGGRKRRTRKRRGTKKAKKGGKRKTKKGGRKTRRNYK